MICSKCDETGELKIFDSFQYYYCLGCKEEIKLMSTAPKNLYDSLNVSEPYLTVIILSLRELPIGVESEYEKV